ncbi:MAG: hypothetical protein AB1611_07600 [bacterium]
MVSTQHLMTSIVFILLVIVFWEIIRSIFTGVLRRLSGIFRQSPPAGAYVRNHEQQVWQARREKFIQDIRQETATLMGQGQMASMLIRDRVLKETREEAQRILREARGEVEKMRRDAILNIQKDMAEMVYSFNQHWQKNSPGQTQGYPKVSNKVIEKYLDSYHALKKNAPQTSSLL